MFKIVVDSAADMPAEVVARYGITVVPVLITFGSETLRDGVELSRGEFYQRLVESKALPKTAAAPIGAYAEAFTRLAADGSQVLSISIAGALSASYSAARQGAALAEAADVACVDGGSLSLPLSFLAQAAAQAANAGQPREQVLALLERLRTRLVLYVGLDTLHYLEKGGRIGRVRALLGAMLDVKPILEVSNSAIHPVGQVRTTRRIAPRLVELTAARGAYAELGVVYTTDRQQAEHLADLCAAAGLHPREQIWLAQVSAGLGTHAGPGAVGVAGLLAE